MEFTAVRLDNISVLIQIADQSVIIGAGLLGRGYYDILKMSQHIIHILHSRCFYIIGFYGSVIKNLLSLFACHGNDFICLSIGLLHDLMFVDQFIRMNGSFIDQSLCFFLGVVQNGLFIADDLLITFDLIRRFHAKFP